MNEWKGVTESMSRLKYNYFGKLGVWLNPQSIWK